MKHDTIGIDISKDKLDVFRQSDAAFAQFDNTPDGIAALRRWLDPVQLARVVYEPTGPYHSGLEQACAGHLPLVKVNPLQARRFAQSTGARAKTDRADARLLARMGAALELEPDPIQPQDQHVLNELHSARLALVKEATRLKVRMKTQKSDLVAKLDRTRLTLLRAQIATLEAEIKARILACPKRRRAARIITSIPGLGAASSAAILIDMPQIGTMERRQLASLAGLAPFTRQSGTWRGQSRIGGGRKRLRDALYMPALVAVRVNPDLRAKYDDLRRRGKPAKVALVAIMRKLLELANALIRQDRTWAPKTP